MPAEHILGAAHVHALETLLQHSMAEYRHEDQRFLLPEPARRYAEGLQAEGTLEQYAPNALAYFAGLISFANNLIATKGQIVEGRNLLTQEQPNLIRFLDWGYAHEQGETADAHGNVCVSARATASLGNYWTMADMQHLPETLERARHALQAAQRLNDRLGEANTRKAMGDVQQFRKEMDAALQSYQQALTLFQAVGDRLGEANTLRAMGDVQQFRKEMDAALQSYQQALTLFQAVGDRLGEANTRRAMGDVQQFRKEMDAALQSYQQALTLFQAVGDRLGEANTLAAQGQISLIEGQEEANQFLQQAINIYQSIGDRYSIAAQTANYGWTLHRIEQLELAREYFRQAAELFAATGLEDRVIKYRQLAEEM